MWPVAPSTAEAPSPDEIKGRTQEILAGGVYNLEVQSEYALNPAWITDMLLAPFRWIGSFTGGAPPFVTWIIVGLCISVLLGILAHTIYAVYAARHTSRMPIFDSEETGPRIGPDELVRQAKALAAQGNYVDASRALYRAALTLLEEKRGGLLRIGFTNTEYLRSFQLPWVRENLRTFVDLIHWKWYRAQNFDVEDYAKCSHALESIETRLNREVP